MGSNVRAGSTPAPSTEKKRLKNFWQIRKNNISLWNKKTKDMTMTEKIARLQELNNEINSIQTNFKTDMFNFVFDEFRKKGFVTDPRSESYVRSLYNPETKVSIHVGYVGKSSVSILVTDMVDEGMNWGKKYHKLTNGTEVIFNYLKTDFDKFYNTTYKNKVEKLNEVLVD